MIGRLKAQWAVIRAKWFFFETHSLSSECEEQRGREKRSKTLMVKLTADLIWNSPHFFNAVKERELELRGELVTFPIIVLGFHLLRLILCILRLQVTRFL